jgi:hypothetical protein
MRMKSLASKEVLVETKDRLHRLTPEDRALWGKMSVMQMLRHLSCSYDVALADREVGPMKGPPPWLLKFAALRSGLRWPKGTPTTPELIRALEEESAATFAELVDENVEKMMAVANGTRWQARHPMFGKMSVKDWMRWGYLHADHHLRQFGR